MQVDTHTQPDQDPRRQQRHLHHVQANGYHAAPATANFLISEAQGPFTFSAEPASMVYDGSMASLSASTPGQESIFTPNVGSSFDSSFHPDMSYSPPSGYNQTQNYRLSSASYHGNDQNISPQHSVEHFSPEAGYMSDQNHQDPSTFPASNFNGHVFDEFSSLKLTENSSTSAFPTFQGNVDMSALTSGTLNTYNAQPPMAQPHASLDPHQQLLSPSATNYSSPAMGDESSSFPSAHHHANVSTPPSHATHLQFTTPVKQTQSPALTNSPGNQPPVNLRPLTRHLTSPIVRVENYSSREGSPSRSDYSRSVSKRSFGSRQSGNHLSPYAHNDTSDEELESQEPSHIHPVVRGPERNEDGSWLTPEGSGQTGLNPDDRRRIGDAWIPSIEEISEQRSKEEKNLEVQEWLTKSEVGSEAGDMAPANNLLKPFTGRRRAKSHNDVQRRAPSGSFGLGVRTDFTRIHDSGIPGPGVYIDERSDFGDYDYEDDESLEPESPPAAIDVGASHIENSYFPPTQDSISKMGAVVKPWVDEPSHVSQTSNPSARYQPPTSNAAMMRFFLRAKDVEQASLTATVGSRRLSESDLGSIRASPGVAKLIEPAPKKISKERQRRPSFLENILPKRTPSNLLKRKGSIPVQQSDASSDKSKEPIIEKPKRMSSWGRPKSPRVDTNLSSHSKEAGPPSSTGLSAAAGPWYKGPKNVIKRSRSRSDIGRSPGIAELMTQHGGPPMPMLASPLADTEVTKPSIQPSPAGEDEDEDQDPVTMDLTVRTDPIVPTYDGFRNNARQLNPRLADFMVERITQEQMRRYKRLLEFRVKHLNAVQNKKCASGSFCTDLGGEAKQLPPRAGAKDADVPFMGFQVSAPGSSDEDGEHMAEGNVVPAAFPSGVPLPPVKRLPAEFECPLCFKVKKFYKPSDWTKHVHEDVQPFTCTFPNCGEPKSFKRKADWVRHENERHRQLEYWTCQLGDCNHTCYRKDNFVQHLVREHKIAEPRQRTGRAGNKEAPIAGDQEDIWAIVERCRHDTLKQPREEPCRFCGNICNSWKKLTVHLAKHMEQISMPILPLVDEKQLNADSIISPVVELPESRKLSMTPSRSTADNSSRHNPGSTCAPGIDPQSLYPPESKLQGASSTMQSYPPPLMAPPSNQVNAYSNFATSSAGHYPNQTYPGLQMPPKPHNDYTHGLQFPNQSYQNRLQQYGMTPVSTVQLQQSMYTDSPVDTNTTPFPSYYTQEPQGLTTEMPNMGYDSSDGMQYHQSSTYPAMSYLTTQDNYRYRHQQ